MSRINLQLQSRFARCITLIASFTWGAIVAMQINSLASDHADPIDSFNKERLEGGITDLFVFPVMQDDRPAHPYAGNSSVPLHFNPAELARTRLTPAELNDFDALVVIMCVRRALTGSGKLNLEPYTYRLQIDWNSVIEFAQQDTPEDLQRAQAKLGQAITPGYMQQHEHDGTEAVNGLHRPERPTPNEAFLRYGGYVPQPREIQEDVTIEFRLNNEAGLKANYPRFLNSQTGVDLPMWKQRVQTYSGVRDDPFIFPAFFGTNIVAMAVRIPMELLPKREADLLVWGTSHKGTRQVDHVGRSLRTQNPRFELLNTRHPRDHAELITREHDNPSLMRDVFNRFNLGSIFAYRRWDFVPDVLIYTTKYPVGFPNGRLLTDDVAALLAQHGDTLLYELSFQHNNGSWPRETRNDVSGGVFGEKFPFLLEPTKNDAPAMPPRLSTRNRWLLIAVSVFLIALFVLENWLVAKIYHRYKLRRRYL